MVLGICQISVAPIARPEMASFVRNSAHCRAPRSLIGNYSRITPSTARSVKKAKAALNMPLLRSLLRHRKVPLPVPLYFAAAVSLFGLLVIQKKSHQSNVVLKTPMCSTFPGGEESILLSLLPISMLAYSWQMCCCFLLLKGCYHKAIIFALTLEM